MANSLGPEMGQVTVPRSAAGIRAALSALALVVVVATGCDRMSRSLVPNSPPTVTLTSGPVDTVSASPAWIVDVAWTATDPDGAIDHFEYALDPPTRRQAFSLNAETTWVSTRESRATVRFPGAPRGALRAGSTGPESHMFALRAIDDRGGVSPVVVRAFFAMNVAPDVQITRPVPNAFLRAQVPLPFRIEWHGDDPDNQGQGKGKGMAPEAYRVRLLDLDDPGNTVFVADPDSLLRHGRDSDWIDWRLVDGDTTFHDVTEFVIGKSGLFAVLAVDKAGATTPYLSLNTNLLQFTVTFPGSSSPLIHVWSPLVDYTYPSGGYSLDPSREIPVEVVEGAQPEFHWDATPVPGRDVLSSRWMLDGDVFDDTPRSDPSDVAHWSAPGPAASSAQLPPLSGGVHRLYIEVTDDFGEKSLAIVRIDVITAARTHELLVVDDTRLEVDRFSVPGTPNVYTQPWPSATELDTFLFARGGVPWRGTKNPTSGVLSSPGLLAGYSFDTLGTRSGLEIPADAVPLSTLLRYRHVLWLVEQRGATFGPTFDQSVFPMTALRAMSRPGFPSALASYIESGGKVWLAGGGAAFASLVEFDRAQNNTGQTTVFTVQAGELGPGRPLHDHAHLRSSVAVTRTFVQTVRSPAARGGWSGHGPDGSLAAPDYSRLPAAMRYRTPDSDPIPPTRLANQGSLYYASTSAIEYVAAPNVIAERINAPGNSPKTEPTLDTLYDASAVPLLVSPAPAMVYYHGRDNAPFVFTGFDLWTWARADCQGLVDFVLGDIWGLPRTGTVANRTASLRPASGARPMQRSVAAARGRAARPWLDPPRVRP